MRYRIAEILCIAALVVFMVFTVSDDRGTDRTAAEIAGEIMTCGEFEGLLERDGKYLKNKPGIDPGQVEDFVFYSSDDVMNVDALLVVKTGENSDGDALSEAVQKYVSDALNVFEGYGDEQTVRLKNCLIKQKGNCFIFAVCADTQSVRNLFEKAMG